MRMTIVMMIVDVMMMMAMKTTMRDEKKLDR